MLMDDALYIVDQAALSELCAHQQSAPWLALDTEFMREHTYYPQLCLIQIASSERIACIDPLALPSLQPLVQLLQQAQITKVFHAAAQDLEVLQHHCGIVPAPIFDTQVAAAVLGYGAQISYADLAQRLLGVALAKHHTRVNWQQRPLAAEWLAYAADDVRYLRDIYQRQSAFLTVSDNLEIVERRCVALANPQRYQPQPASAWRRVRDYQQLRTPHQKALLQALAAWREQQAIREDRPRRWVLSDALLCDLARYQPHTLEELAQLRGFSATLRKRYASALLSLIAKVHS